MNPDGAARSGGSRRARGAVGLWILVRLALKRDRVMIPAWVLGLGAAVAVTASSYSSLYATEASRREVVRTFSIGRLC